MTRGADGPSHLAELLNAIGRGVSHHELLALDEYLTRGDEIGHDSERRVADALRALPQVIEVRQTERRGAADRNGIDLMVWLRDYVPPPRKIYVQVKTSRTGLEQHHAKARGKAQDRGLSYDEYRLQFREIALRARSVERIQRDFLDQLAELQELWQQRQDAKKAS